MERPLRFAAEDIDHLAMLEQLDPGKRSAESALTEARGLVANATKLI